MIVVALLVAAVAGLLLLRRPTVRVRIDSAALGARQKVAELRGHAVPEDGATDEPVEGGPTAVGAVADEELSAVI